MHRLTTETVLRKQLSCHQYIVIFRTCLNLNVINIKYCYFNYGLNNRGSLFSSPFISTTVISKRQVWYSLSVNRNQRQVIYFIIRVKKMIG